MTRERTLFKTQDGQLWVPDILLNRKDSKLTPSVLVTLVTLVQWHRHTCMPIWSLIVFPRAALA